jgi:hypothetical protein
MKKSSERTALVPVPAFDPDLLPETLRPWCADIAERMQCPLDFVAVAAMVTLAAVVGRQMGIRPKQHDDWQVVPNLWGLLIGRPGVMKSPPMKEATNPLIRLECKAKDEYDTATAEYASRSMVAEARRKIANAKLRSAIQKGDADPDAIAADTIAEEEPQPIRRRFLVNDPTPEKLQVILAENPNGVVNLRDEAQGLLRSLDKPGREDARAFYIECWSGDGRFTVDRIGRGTLDIPACCVSILATIQPGPLQSYLFDAVNGGKGDDGMMPRFQLAVWPDVSPEWRNVDRWPDTSSRQQAFGLIESLADLEPFTIDADRDDHNPVPFLRFNPEAQVAFNEWLADLEYTVRAGELPVALEAVLAKHRSLVPSLALLIHLADGGTGPVTVPALDRAVGWARCLFVHARRIYGAVPTPEGKHETELLDWIWERDGHRATARELAHGLRRFRGDTARAEAALDALVKAGIGEWVPVPPGPRGGRATRVFRLLPRVTVTTTPAKPGRNGGSGDGDTCHTDEINHLLDEAAEENA